MDIKLLEADYPLISHNTVSICQGPLRSKQIGYCLRRPDLVLDPNSATAVASNPDPAADVMLKPDSVTLVRPDLDPDANVVAEPYSATAAEPNLDPTANVVPKPDKDTAVQPKPKPLPTWCSNITWLPLYG